MKTTHMFPDRMGNDITIGCTVAVVVKRGWVAALAYGEVLSVDSKIKVKGFGAKRTCKEVLVLKTLNENQ